MSTVHESVRICSADREILKGMLAKDANTSPETAKLFSFADINGDGKIDEKEWLRYNGPILVEKPSQKTARIIDKTQLFSLNELDIGDDELSYYPGLTLEEVDEEREATFAQLDTNHDGVLSAEEMKSVVEAQYRINKAKSNLEKFDRFGIAKIGLYSLTGMCITGTFYKAHKKLCKSLLVLGPILLGLKLAFQIYVKQKAKNELKTVENINHPYLAEEKAKLRDIV